MVGRYMLVYYGGEIINTGDGATFSGQSPICVNVRSSVTLLELKNTILQKLSQQNNRQITQVLYRLPIVFGKGVIRYRSFPISSDDDVSFMFECHAQFPEIRIMELFIILEDLHFSSGESATGPAYVGTSLLEHSLTFEVASPVHNEDVQTENTDDMMGSPSFAHLAMQIAEPLPRDGPIAGFDFIVDHEDNEDESLEVPFDSNSGEGSDGDAESVTQSQPLRTQSQSHKHVGHYASLNLEAMHDSTFPRFGGPIGGGDVLGLPGENELHVGKHFPNKEAVLFAVKNYSIQRSVQYKVLESDHVTYHGKCKYFGNECSWSIRVTYLRKKKLWEIRKYNGPHTCVSASLSQDHPKLDTNVICAIIFSTVQADPNVSIKVLQELVDARYSFKTSYRKVWLAKQKAIAKVYGDWEESYNDLPRWLQGLQRFMPGSVIQLLTLPYHVGNFVDHSYQMFHRLFWTFPPCIEAFKYCKPFITVDGTHLYGKYGGTLLMAIAQDGNSNILPIAFAVVEEETREAWSFFLTNLRQHVTPQEGILIISDR